MRPTIPRAPAFRSPIHVGIWDWRAEGHSTVYFEDNHKQWYKAELFSPSPDLPFVEFIGIDARPSGTLDKWGAVYIHGQRYPFKLRQGRRTAGEEAKVDRLSGLT